jgi:hypothetical protein
MATICDICGKQLSPAEVNTVQPTTVVAATAMGYVPSRLPASWKPQCEMLGISVAQHWGKVVDANARVDWGLCKDCQEEVTHVVSANPGAKAATDLFNALGLGKKR